MSPSPQIAYTLKLNRSKPGRLYFAPRNLLTMAMPTLFAAPCPSGPVVVSTPVVKCDSGCPGVLLSSCRKRLISSIETAGLSRILSFSSASFTPTRCRMEYNSIDAWPAERTKRSRFGHSGFAGSYFKMRCHRVYATAAKPIGAPGCPELAFCTASMDKVRIVSMLSWSRSFCGCA